MDFLYMVVALFAVFHIGASTPTINVCPFDKRVTASFSSVTAFVTWDEPSTTDLNDILVFQSHLPGVLPVGMNYVTYRFSDTSGSTADCEFSVEILAADSTSPEITGCPDDVIAVYELGQDQATATWTEPTATDESGSAVLQSRSHIPGNIFNLWTKRHVVQYTFSDASSNTKICSFTVIFEGVDTTPPIVRNCPSVVENDCDINENGTIVTWVSPDIEDNSGQYQVKLETPLGRGSFFPVGITAVSYNYGDAAGHISQCRTSVIVNRKDNIPPTVESCPQDVVKGISINTHSDVFPVWWGVPVGLDNSGIVSIVYQSRSPGEVFQLDVPEIVEYRLADPSGNEVSCSFTVSVIIDTMPPRIVGCPRNITRVVDKEYADLSWVEPYGIDDVSYADLVFESHNSDEGSFPLGATDVTYVFSDEASNLAYCNFTIFVTNDANSIPDSQSPNSSCPLKSDSVVIMIASICVALAIVVLGIVAAVTCCKIKQMNKSTGTEKSKPNATSNRYTDRNSTGNAVLNVGYDVEESDRKVSRLGPVPPVPTDQSYMELRSNEGQTVYYMAPKS